MNSDINKKIEKNSEDTKNKTESLEINKKKEKNYKNLFKKRCEEIAEESFQDKRISSQIKKWDFEDLKKIFLEKIEDEKQEDFWDFLDAHENISYELRGEVLKLKNTQEVIYKKIVSRWNISEFEVQKKMSELSPLEWKKLSYSSEIQKFVNKNFLPNWKKEKPKEFPLSGKIYQDLLFLNKEPWCKKLWDRVIDDIVRNEEPSPEVLSKLLTHISRDSLVKIANYFFPFIDLKKIQEIFQKLFKNSEVNDNISSLFKGTDRYKKASQDQKKYFNKILEDGINLSVLHLSFSDLLYFLDNKSPDKIKEFLLDEDVITDLQSDMGNFLNVGKDQFFSECLTGSLKEKIKKDSIKEGGLIEYVFDGQVCRQKILKMTNTHITLQNTLVSDNQDTIPYSILLSKFKTSKITSISFMDQIGKDEISQMVLSKFPWVSFDEGMIFSALDDAGKNSMFRVKKIDEKGVTIISGGQISGPFSFQDFYMLFEKHNLKPVGNATDLVGTFQCAIAQFSDKNKTIWNENVKFDLGKICYAGKTEDAEWKKPQEIRHFEYGNTILTIEKQEWDKITYSIGERDREKEKKEKKDIKFKKVKKYTGGIEHVYDELMKYKSHIPYLWEVDTTPEIGDEKPKSKRDLIRWYLNDGISVATILHGVELVKKGINKWWEDKSRTNASALSIGIIERIPFVWESTKLDIRRVAENENKARIKEIVDNVSSTQGKQRGKFLEDILLNKNSSNFQLVTAYLMMLKTGGGNLYTHDLAPYAKSFYWYKRLGGTQGFLNEHVNECKKTGQPVIEQLLIKKFFQKNYTNHPLWGNVWRMTEWYYKEWVEGHLTNGPKESMHLGNLRAKNEFAFGKISGGEITQGIGIFEKVAEEEPGSAEDISHIPFTLVFSGSVNLIFGDVKDRLCHVERWVGKEWRHIPPAMFAWSRADVEIFQDIIVDLSKSISEDAGKQAEKIVKNARDTSTDFRESVKDSYDFWQTYGTQLVREIMPYGEVMRKKTFWWDTKDNKENQRIKEKYTKYYDKVYFNIDKSPGGVGVKNDILGTHYLSESMSPTFTDMSTFTSIMLGNSPSDKRQFSSIVIKDVKNIPNMAEEEIQKIEKKTGEMWEFQRELMKKNLAKEFFTIFYNGFLNGCRKAAEGSVYNFVKSEFFSGLINDLDILNDKDFREEFYRVNSPSADKTRSGNLLDPKFTEMLKQWDALLEKDFEAFWKRINTTSRSTMQNISTSANHILEVPEDGEELIAV